MSPFSGDQGLIRRESCRFWFMDYMASWGRLVCMFWPRYCFASTLSLRPFPSGVRNSASSRVSLRRWLHPNTQSHLPDQTDTDQH